MKILVIEGSPHKHGSSNLLAERFIDGARDAGHVVSVFDAAHANLHPCLGCDTCGMAGVCIQKDDMESLKDDIRDSDMMVFVTPLYYFGFSAQIKMVIDRFYSFNGELTSKGLKTALIAAAWNNDNETMEFLKNHYLKLCNYLNFKKSGHDFRSGLWFPFHDREDKISAKSLRLWKITKMTLHSFLV
ncbi:flavodoxin family protein [Thermoanaerobacterium thermosaccharolyticum]|uniref:flavodoxin family protein n=1 Tax=Thermoanaerobacterium thermosaccharolyticum TaxID=1517 RepID=UPI001C531B95|nr:flavodoxin family protein [Thermoanaerobacterium thermosaccharolyticum]